RQLSLLAVQYQYGRAHHRHVRGRGGARRRLCEPLGTAHSAALVGTMAEVVATLHIEHEISDFATWKRAFDGFAERRQQAGVTAHRIYQPYDDPHYVLLQLDFPAVEQAASFQSFLETQVWTSRERSPALAGVPRA